VSNATKLQLFLIALDNFWLHWTSYNKHDFFIMFVHTFHGMEGIILAFGKVVMNDYHKFKHAHVVLIEEWSMYCHSIMFPSFGV
jgi:hypothetical protein